MNFLKWFSSRRKVEDVELHNMPDEVEEDEPCEDPSIYFDSLKEIPVDGGRSLIFP